MLALDLSPSQITFNIVVPNLNMWNCQAKTFRNVDKAQKKQNIPLINMIHSLGFSPS